LPEDDEGALFRPSFVHHFRIDATMPAVSLWADAQGKAAMDWAAAIEWNRTALTRVLAMLVAMTGVGSGQSAIAGRQSEQGSAQVVDGLADRLSPAGGHPPLLPRHLHRAVLRLLRPAEAAARRLVIAAARGLMVAPVTMRQARPDQVTVRRGAGISKPAIVLAPPPLTPPHKGEGAVHVAPRSPACAPSAKAAEFPSPLWGGVRGGGTKTSAGKLGFPLFDSLPRDRPYRPRQSSVPRISVPGFSRLAPVTVRPPPAPDDLLDATRLNLRLSALQRVLDDLPRQAQRFARWQARSRERRDGPGEPRSLLAGATRVGRTGAGATGVVRAGAAAKRRWTRIWPLRPGRPPGWRRRFKQDVHHILDNAHGLALFALAERPDTS
jgi:hypothetical protein